MLPLFVFCLITLCYSQDLFELTMDDNNTVVQAAIGDKIIVSLDGKPTTGHIWENYYLEGNAIIQDGEPYYIRNHSNPGANGVYKFPYVANQVGDARIRLTEGRSWEDEPINVFYCSFVVSKATGNRVKSN